MLFFILFILIPVLEIITFIAVADEIGLLFSLLLIIISGIIGVAIIRIQGVATLLSLRPALLHTEFPAQELFDALCITFAGVLFIIPGFLSDIVAILLLITPVRHHLRKHMQTHIAVMATKNRRPAQDDFYSAKTHQFHVEDPDIIDGDYERVDDPDEKQ